MLQFFLLFTSISADIHSNLFNECRRLFNPINYMDQLPSLSLPYLDHVKIPINQQLTVKPTPVKPTKVISITTQYLYKNPICIKISGKKTLCPSHDLNNLDFIVTKEYFVNRNQRQLSNDIGLYLETSEEFHPSVPKSSPTPKLTPQQIRDELIEDRLDHLEAILPYYKRKRHYQTTTITVTKVISNNRATATLLVKNCIPQGYDLCPPKIRTRKSKIAQYTNATDEQHFYG